MGGPSYTPITFTFTFTFTFAFEAGYDADVQAAATYPGTVTPLRGLTWFGESERDVLFGRDREREALAKLVVGEGFRAGLLYGELGVGKTSLLRAGLVPFLRDHGVIALMCEDLGHPVDSFATALAQMTGRQRAEGENAITYLGRVVGEAMKGQMFLFILDDADDALALGDHVAHELGDLFARVVSRSGGRARFLFATASDRVHRLGALERRTGSLFPPQNRFELERFQPEVAAEVLDRTLALAGQVIDRDLPRALADAAGAGGPVLPADLQLLALAARTLGIASPADLARVGGAGELEGAWLKSIAGQVGSERAVLRTLAELSEPSATPPSVEWVASRAGVDPAVARQALAQLAERGITRAVEVPGSADFHFALSHEILARRVKDVAAPARAAARRAHELIGSKVGRNKRLTAGELREVEREGLAPTTPDERAVIVRSQRFFRVVAGAIGAAALVIVVGLYAAQCGRYYLDADRDRVVARAGRAGLSWFHWLPGAGLGDVVADPGLSRATVSKPAWQAIVDRDLGGARGEADLGEQWLDALRPGHRAVIAYATRGDEKALEPLGRALDQPLEMAALLELLAPTARGLPAEIALVERALATPSPVVQAAALEVATAATRRSPAGYGQLLAHALAATDPELRRLALSAVRRLGGDAAQRLYQVALAAQPDPTARRELIALVTGAPGAAAPSADAALAMLRNKDQSPASRDKARALLRRAFAAAPVDAAKAAAQLAADVEATPADRTFAIELLYELAPKEAFADIADPIKGVLSSQGDALRAAALPLWVHINPEAGAGDLAVMLQDAGLSPEMQEAMALAWGEVARGKDRGAAQGALETLLKSSSAKVRAAAARAYGFVGRDSQEDLIKLIKKDRFDVALGAANGLANSAEAGGSASQAVFGIAQLWKKKGRPRRDAAEVFARMARSKPAAVDNYLNAAARSTEDAALRPIGVRGLCNALVAGDKGAARALARAIEGAPVEARRAIIECVADNPTLLAQTGGLAVALAGDADAEVRREAAGVLVELAAGDKPDKAVGETLARLAADDARDVRVVAIGALARLGAAAPKSAADALPRAFDAGDEAERLVVLAAARAIGVGELVPLAVADASPQVRIAALETAVATRSAVAGALSAALTDADASVRRAALERLAAGGHGMSPEEVDRALGLAIDDADPTIATVALTAMARLGDPATVAERLQRLLGAASEAERAKAATAGAGLVATDAKRALAVLEPVLADPSHDVRAALVGSLAAAYAQLRKPDDLAAALADAEDDATRRLALATALALRAAAEDGAPARAALAKVAKDGPPLARIVAAIVVGTLDGGDPAGVLVSLVP
jgi:hypothetical protein